MSSLNPIWSNVEKCFINKSNRQDIYNNEKIACIEVQNIYELGRLVALRFLEWVRDNPNGIIALPTGRTPEYFIKTLDLFKKNWNDESMQQSLKDDGYLIDGKSNVFPDMKSLRFVMLDEFFPMFPTFRNSFCNYVNLFYIEPMGIPKENVLSFDLIGQKIITEEEMNDFMGIDVDLTLLTREPLNDTERRRKDVLLRVQQFCKEYEEKIREMGGIGFFLGGIGPDGHIAFNQEGCDHNCTTRLVDFNYPSAAAAANDLGGIENARGRAAMTIGLATISYNKLINKNSTAIIMAAGEGKASVVRAGIEDDANPSLPSTILHSFQGGRFYITHGAAIALTARKAERIANISKNVIDWALTYLSGVNTTDNSSLTAHLVEPPSDYHLVETILYDTSLKSGKPVHKLVVDDLQCLTEAQSAPSWVKDTLTFQILITCASRRLRDKVEAGLRSCDTINTSILHTAPHHDDIMLSYHAAMHGLLGRDPVNKAVDFNTIRPHSQRRSVSGSNNFIQLGELYNDNVNHFAYLTSGFHSVNDSFLQEQVTAVSKPNNTYQFLHDVVCAGEIGRDYDDLMAQFHNAFFAKNFIRQDHTEHIIFLRKVAEVWQISTSLKYDELENELKKCIEWIKNNYLGHYDHSSPKEIQMLKGCMRESEVDRVWALSRMPMNRIHHMRSKFYNDDFFTAMPSLTDDALPMANLIKARQPEIITVAFDPEGTGPDTHYKVLLVVAAGLRISKTRKDLANANPIVWGYRNVWFVFTPSDTTLMTPGSEADLDLMHDTFMSSFTTQKAASFPSPYYEGPFSAWARSLQREQKKILVTLLGDDYFANHYDARVRNATGFVFLKAMYADHFLREVEELKSKFENT